jgi:hypothetical protein
VEELLFTMMGREKGGRERGKREGREGEKEGG